MKQINKLEFHIEVPQKMFNFSFFADMLRMARTYNKGPT